MSFPRASGILLHPSSLPSRGGIGDFGPAAYAFADFLGSARQGLWQVLPLGPLGFGNSPYSSTSAFAGNPLLISLERLADRGWIDRTSVDALPNGTGFVDYPDVFHHKLPLLFEAARRFVRSAAPPARGRYETFCQQNKAWLDDFVLFDGLRAHFKLESWNHWPREIVHRDPAAIAKVQAEMHDELDVRRAVQFFFYEQWQALRTYCAQKSIRVVGDMAIFVNFDSADVWTHSDLFRLNSALDPEVVAGVPPDFFSKTGQRWGNPLYRWDVMKEEGYTWWIDRMRWLTRNFDYIRLDHFRGFSQFWEIPASEPTAVNGRWVDGPKDDLFLKLHEALGGLPFFAEDLGYITPDVTALRERLKIPGMAVLQFGFGDVGAHTHLPHTFTVDKVVYTGTHDNDTLLGWWKSGATEFEHQQVESYMGRCADDVNWSMIRAASTSVAALSVVPLQDVLGLGSEGRMNVPSLAQGNWRWRFAADLLHPELGKKLATLAGVCDRLPQALSALANEEWAA
ncbi:MAG TPA: 4-alpha-glucanotransferase [Terriglobales bacterium]|jgi:4-alpha-glucanotransferase|nr:4-alpha-glucanotransferase [Terriglobales bacterium]